jgi:hypothetical protein
MGRTGPRASFASTAPRCDPPSAGGSGRRRGFSPRVLPTTMCANCARLTARLVSPLPRGRSCTGLPALTWLLASVDYVTVTKSVVASVMMYLLTVLTELMATWGPLLQRRGVGPPGAVPRPPSPSSSAWLVARSRDAPRMPALPLKPSGPVAWRGVPSMTLVPGLRGHSTGLSLPPGTCRGARRIPTPRPSTQLSLRLDALAGLWWGLTPLATGSWSRRA